MARAHCCRWAATHVKLNDWTHGPMKRPTAIAGGIVAALVALGAVAGAFVWTPEIAPIDPSRQARLDPEPMRKGANLAALGDCNTCHTAPDGQAFAGGLPMPTPFGTRLLNRRHSGLEEHGRHAHRVGAGHGRIFGRLHDDGAGDAVRPLRRNDEVHLAGDAAPGLADEKPANMVAIALEGAGGRTPPTITFLISPSVWQPTTAIWRDDLMRPPSKKRLG